MSVAPQCVPIVLSGYIPGINAFQTLGIDQSRLQAQYPGGAFIDQVRFKVPDGIYILDLQAELKINDIPITRNFVPMSAFGKSHTYEDNRTSPTTMVFNWKLKKPLYLRSGEVLTVSIQNASIDFDTAISEMIEVTYIGRGIMNKDYENAIIDGQVKTYRPWVTAFIGVRRELGTSDFTDRSTETDLKNPFDVPMLVEHFVGRMSIDGMDPNYQGGTSGIGSDAYLGYTFCRMWDSASKIIVRDPTPFGHLFHMSNKIWTVNSILPPKGFYIIDLDEQVSVVDDADFMTPIVSMVGYREVQR